MKQAWTYDLIDIQIHNGDLSVMEFNLTVVKIKRGEYAMNGWLDIRQDMDDSLFLEMKFFTSQTGGPNAVWKKMSMEMRNSSLTTFMNKHYKTMVMESLKECTENAPVFDEFEAPLTKRLIKINNCIFKSDNMPAQMAKGFYKLPWKFSGQYEGSVEFYLEISYNM